MATRPRIIPFVILLAVLLPITTAAGRAKMHGRRRATIQELLKYYAKHGPKISDAQDWNWTMKARSPADYKRPMPKNVSVLNHMCWAYFAHRITIRDVRAFFRWGCQPYPITCNGIKMLPKQCIDHMFYVLNKRIRPAQVKQLQRRCHLKVRPIDRRTRKYITYCEDLFTLVRRRVRRLAASRSALANRF